MDFLEKYRSHSVSVWRFLVWLRVALTVSVTITIGITITLTPSLTSAGLLIGHCRWSESEVNEYHSECDSHYYKY